jgi:putative FmdB family regulatory protein
MPTYEYLCSHCGNEWEEIQKISEPPIQTCPKCSNATAKRQISGGSFILKGGGWYADLYSSAKPSSKKEDGSESKSASESKDKKETSSSDSKPEAKEAAPAKAESPAPSKAPAASSGPAK